ncbi:MAG TPA: M1 family metallopeptidase [Burkholderiales bacterium]|nr:M1 family metallopeptidase [Burkholderiales bacterium]
MQRPAVFLLFAAAVLSAGHAAGEPRFSFATTPGKLPKDVVPRHYALRIAPGADRFEAEAGIDIDVKAPVQAIVLNASELSFKSVKLRAAGGDELVLAPSVDPKQETVALTAPRAPIAPGSYQLRIEYSGKIGRHPEGLYRIDYKQREAGGLVEKTMLATHMEPVSARKLFPGWDEPVFRASFEVTVLVDRSLTVVSNMPQSRAEPRPDGKKEVSFARSVPMSAYLVALFVGEMDALEEDVDGIRLRIYSAKGKRESARYAMESTRQIVRYYNEYFGERYPLDKLDQVALPGGSGGAMENWGAIAYNEGRLLYNPRADSPRQRQQVYNIIAHEIAHQWFGNLVTLAWWDNLWLNEGFATWMASKATERLRPEWKMRLRDSLGKDWALGEDARRTTHPIQTRVDDDFRAMEVFDSISYAKGAAVLRMLETYLGEDVFRAGVQGYLKAHRFSNTTTADLWHHLSRVSGRDILELVSGWTEQPGYPVVRVSQRCDNGEGVVTLSQERFTLNHPGAQILTWKVPVVLADAGGSRRTVLLEEGSKTTRLPGCGPIVANAGDAGFYRVEYADAAFRNLSRDLKNLAALDRLRLLSDTFALVQAGRSEVSRYLALVENLGGEAERTIWDQVIGSLRFFGDLLDRPDERAAFDRYVSQVLRQPLSSVGWDRKPGEAADAGLLRRSLIEALGRAGDPATVQEAQARFAARMEKPIDPSIRSAVLNVAGRYADEGTYRALLGRLRNTTDENAKWETLSALRQMRDPRLLRQVMELMLTDELPPAEAVFNLTHLGGDSGEVELVWRFVTTRLSDVLAKASPRGRMYVLPNTAFGFSDAARADELLAATRAHLDATALYQAEKTADWIRIKAAVKEREAARAVAWARAHSRPG